MYLNGIKHFSYNQDNRFSSHSSEANSIRSLGYLIPFHFYTFTYLGSLFWECLFRSSAPNCCILTTWCFFIQPWFWPRYIVNTYRSSLPSTVLSVDNELCLVIPMLLDIYNFIFIPVNIFGMHKSFFRGNAQKQLYWDNQWPSLRRTAPQFQACHHARLRELLLCHCFPEGSGEEIEEGSSVCSGAAHFSWDGSVPSWGGSNLRRSLVSYNRCFKLHCVHSFHGFEERYPNT